MGLDGGSLPNRREYLVKTRNLDSSSHVSEFQKQSKKVWTTCALTGKPLWEPICVCGKGLLYNKESILKWLIRLKIKSVQKGYDRSKKCTSDRKLSHIREMKDLITLKMDVNPKKYDIAIQGESRGLAESDIDSFWICPITGRVANGISQFIFFIECGHAMSLECVRPTQSSVSSCLLCGSCGPYFYINPIENNDDQLNKFRAAIVRKSTKQLLWKDSPVSGKSTSTIVSTL